MGTWRTSVGLIALVAVLAALVLPLHGRGPLLRATPAQAQGAQQPQGDAFRGLISIEGKEVPLPAGEWLSAGRAVSGTQSLSVLSVALVRLNGEAVDAAVLIQTNQLNSDPSWGKATACDRTDLYFARTRYSSDHDGSCAYAAYVDATGRSNTIDPAWQAAMLHGVGEGWRFPRHWLEATYRITDPRDALQVHYVFASPDRVDRTVVKSLVSWTEASWFVVGNGFRNRLSVEDALPDWRQPDAAHATVLPQAATEENQIEHLGAKMITYRIFGTMTDMSVNYLWLGSLPSATGLAVVSAAASSVLYFFHELAWSHLERPPALVGDLPGVGIEGPGPG